MGAPIGPQQSEQMHVLRDSGAEGAPPDEGPGPWLWFCACAVEHVPPVCSELGRDRGRGLRPVCGLQPDRAVVARTRRPRRDMEPVPVRGRDLGGQSASAALSSEHADLSGSSDRSMGSAYRSCRGWLWAFGACGSSPESTACGASQPLGSRPLGCSTDSSSASSGACTCCTAPFYMLPLLFLPQPGDRAPRRLAGAGRNAVRAGPSHRLYNHHFLAYAFPVRGGPLSLGSVEFGDASRDSPRSWRCTG